MKKMQPLLAAQFTFSILYPVKLVGVLCPKYSPKNE